MLTEHGHVKVMDFGLAKHFADESPGSEAPARSAADDSLTKTGARMGTPAYLSPEQIRGESLDARSDFFSFGSCSTKCWKDPERAPPGRQ